MLLKYIMNNKTAKASKKSKYGDKPNILTEVYFTFSRVKKDPFKVQETKWMDICIFFIHLCMLLLAIVSLPELKYI